MYGYVMYTLLLHSQFSPSVGVCIYR